MAKGYWISRLDVHDGDGYKPYLQGAEPAIAAFGGRFLVRGGEPEVLEGTARSRNVVVEFKDYETALACFHSPEYQAAYTHRAASSEGEHLVIEGYTGDQPAAGTISGPAQGPGTGYWVMRIDVHDMETYKSYVAADALAIAKYEGWFVVRGGRHEGVHGEARSRNVLVAFKDYDTALACYHSPEYQAALAFRSKAAVAEVIAIGGV
ncbi:DUF1330 domain-containing protein [Ancylobacter dichloromethanicus]|uniref:DUF1330 domain-containing protein n=1 Tax=Ancylobacter dichloromethanicus TaxID=518825 RepID=A0A9W6J9X7_9HYPH|nr:DUF1330 domain-containing protein [Ancylobacter dichloromethanicus]GLK71990.1 hypothetical protein GCM10017643_21060 [Ancylobacter dichloromethanicus]